MVAERERSINVSGKPKHSLDVNRVAGNKNKSGGTSKGTILKHNLQLKELIQPDRRLLLGNILVSTGYSIHDDMWEQILVRLGVKDLIRCKKVCKSWKSLISHPRFVKAHHTRQLNLVPSYKPIIRYQLKTYGPKYYMVGSSNGLVCINSFSSGADAEIVVVNPWTREERIFQKPNPHFGSCWGFGYDPLTNDYKIVYGAVLFKGKTLFHVLSLKSNVWKHVGHVNYHCSYIQIATLCNGVLHWALHSRIPSTVIISFDLSTEVFKEFIQPDDAIREFRFLGIRDICVSRFNDYRETNLPEGVHKFNVTLYWANLWDNNYYTLIIDKEDPYTFLPATVTPSLISPHVQDANE